MPFFQLKTLGRLELLGPDAAACETLLRQPKRLSLLIYLLVAGRGGFMSRDRLLALFWPESDEARARRALNQVLHHLRRALGEDAILSRGDEVGAAAENVWCDAAALAGALDAGRGEAALGLYGGDFLPGFFVSGAPEFEAWLDGERERLRRRVLAAALELAEAGASPERMAAWARHATELLGFDETALQRVIQLLDRAGDRAGAVDVYERYARRLAEELDVEPSAETRALILGVRARSETYPAAATSPARTAASPSGAAAPATAATAAPSPSAPAEGSAGGADAAEAAAGATAAGLRTTAAARAPRSASTRWRRPAAAVIVLSLGGMLLSGIAFRRPPRAPAIRPRIAVLPFADATAGHELGDLPAALTAGVVRELAAVEGFEVREAAPGGSRPARDAGDAGADQAGPLRDLVLRGSMLAGDSRLRIDVRLSLARSGEVLAARSVEREGRDTVAVVDDLARAVAALVRTKIGREIRTRQLFAGTEGERTGELLEVAEEYRRRADALQQAGAFDAAARAVAEADSVLLEAERLAPNRPEPRIARADLAKVRALMRYAMPPLRDLAAARAALLDGMAEADRAVHLDGGGSAALEASGSLRYLLWLMGLSTARGPDVIREAADQLRHAVALDPARATAWSDLSGLLEASGDFAGAYLAAERAYKADAYLEDVEEILYRLSTTAYEIGDDGAARAWCMELARRLPGSGGATDCRLFQLAWAPGPHPGAAREVGEVLRNTTDPHRWESRERARLQLLVATVLAREGMRDSAQALLGRTAAALKQDAPLLVLAAGAQFALGQEAEAVASLTDYARLGLPDRSAMLGSRRFAALRPALARVIGHSMPAPPAP